MHYLTPHKLTATLTESFVCVNASKNAQVKVTLEVTPNIQTDGQVDLQKNLCLIQTYDDLINLKSCREGWGNNNCG